MVVIYFAMEDTLLCPICGSKLRNNHLHNQFMPILGKTATFVERSCSLQHNHSIRFLVDAATGKIDFLRLPLNPQCSRFIEINYHLNKSRISCWKDNKPDYLEIDKTLEPDFPDLTKLRDKVETYVLFS